MLPDKESPLAEFVHSLLAEQDAVVPFVWWFEVRNLLVVAERRQRVSSFQLDDLIATLDLYSIALDCDARSSHVLFLARRHSLSVYDAIYVELALRLDLPLATLDRRMAKAAETESVNLIIAASH